MKRFLEITDYSMIKTKIELIIDENCIYKEKRYCSWGVTSVGCTFETKEGEFIMIHPKSVFKMRQWFEEETI